ncbi:MAG: signal peptidase I [Eubacteriales bacterium]|nr:signal peptidase I [Eubacteriales bacterium]
MGLYTYDDNLFIRKLIRMTVDVVVVISAAWFLVYSFLNQTIVTGNSMTPVLEASDMCLVNKITYDLGKPKRFDVILFERQDTGKTNVKRVIGLPGEDIRISGGIIYINGEALKDERLSEIQLSGLAENGIKLAKDEYFVIGDNANSSEDSRFSNIGNIKKSNIKGKVWLILKPFSRFGVIK